MRTPPRAPGHRRTGGTISLVAGLLAGAAASAPAPADAQTFVFTHQRRTNAHAARDFSASYALRVKRGVAEHVKSDASDGGTGGGTGGGGGGGRAEYEGVMHRLAAGYGVTDWLGADLEQSIKQADLDEISLGVLALGVNANVNELLDLSIPVEVSPFVQTRLRLSARRPHTLVSGVGLDRQLDAWWLTGRVGYETSVDAEANESGFRYRTGVARDLVTGLLLSLEVWGQTTWRADGTREQDHHGGPGLRLDLDPLSVALGASFGMKERPSKIFYDVSTSVHVGLSI